MRTVKIHGGSSHDDTGVSCHRTAVRNNGSNC
jgi:hypothetical protein